MPREVGPIDERGWLGAFLPLDATDPGGDPYRLGGPGGGVGGFLVKIDPDDGAPSPERDSLGRFEPRNWRLSHLPEPDPVGRRDRRLELQLIVDHDAVYEDGSARYGQPEFFDARNRSSRMVDAAGRVALRTSHERIVDSEDQRYAVALTLVEMDIGDSAEDLPVPAGGSVGGGAVVPEGVVFRSAGSTGGITQTRPSVSIGGVTFFGAAAVNAAQAVIAAGGAAAIDVARAASAASRGLPPPPPLASQSPTLPAQPAPTPPPNRNPGGSYDVANHPGGYVVDEGARRIGLLGTVFIPGGAQGSYAAGREGTNIGPLPIRHDAQFHMAPQRTGRIFFASNDASGVEQGEKPFKGAMWWDPTRADIDTELGLETGQWRPVVWVSADLPPSSPPPREEDPHNDPGGGGGGEEEEPEYIPQPLPIPIGPGKPPGTPPPGGTRPPGGADPSDPDIFLPSPPIDPSGPANQCKVKTGANSGETYVPTTPGPPRGGEEFPSGFGPYGTPSPTAPGPTNPTCQVRNYLGDGVPCLNRPAGRPLPGGGHDEHGHPPMTPVPGGIAAGGRPETVEHDPPPPTDSSSAPVDGAGGGAGAGDDNKGGPSSVAPSNDQLRIPLGIQPPGTKAGFVFVETRTRVVTLEEQIARDEQKIKDLRAEIKAVDDDLKSQTRALESRTDLSKFDRDLTARALERRAERRKRSLERRLANARKRQTARKERHQALKEWRADNAEKRPGRERLLPNLPMAQSDFDRLPAHVQQYVRDHYAVVNPANAGAASPNVQGAYIITTNDASNFGSATPGSLPAGVSDLTATAVFDSMGRRL